MTTSASSSPPSAVSHRHTFVAFLRREWPYLLMILLSLGGVAYSSVFPLSSAKFWQILAPIFGLICIATLWPKASAAGRQWRLIGTQIVHWAIFALSMELLFLPDVQRTMESLVVGLIVLYLLAMSTFLVGVYYLAWRLCIVGVFLGAAIPAIALLDEAALLLLGVAILLIAGAYLYHWFIAGREEMA